MCDGELEAAPIGAGERVVFAGLATRPDGAHRVGDPAGGQAESRRDARVACRAGGQGSAGTHQLGPGSVVDRTVNTASSQQGAVGGVDDAVYVLLGDVAPDECDPSVKDHTSSLPRLAIRPRQSTARAGRETG